ncbi:hypothetical protein CANINC_004468 [Pichia inconspicua]|uniref:SH3 domain-containing protein n=1 Tax=Pichia inconspicua TaxID=52247 RepID=A0A4T0WVD4_9ASCO|nr:hypothetical protein CANINC_004468 [[Candida] inconspicua]
MASTTPTPSPSQPKTQLQSNFSYRGLGLREKVIRFKFGREIDIVYLKFQIKPAGIVTFTPIITATYRVSTMEGTDVNKGIGDNSEISELKHPSKYHPKETQPSHQSTLTESRSDDPNDTSFTDSEPTVNIKDFAYDLSDPRHFGIYPPDDTDENDLEDEGKYDSEEEFQDSIGYMRYESIDPEEEYIDKNSLFVEGRSILNDEVSSELEKNDSNDVDDDDTGLVHAIALYPFVPENSNELSLVPDQHLIINYECGDGWLVAYDPGSGQTGLVPSEYIYIVDVDPVVEEFDDDDVDNAQRFMPELLGHNDSQNVDNETQRLSQKFNDLSV